MYIEDWGKLNIKNKSQLSCAVFVSKYGSLALYDEYMEKIFIIDHKQLHFDKNSGCNLSGSCDKHDGNYSDPETVCIHDDLFDRIKSTRQDKISCGGLYQMKKMRMNL